MSAYPNIKINPDKYVMSDPINNFPTPEELDDEFTYSFLKIYQKFMHQDCDASLEEAKELQSCIKDLRKVYKKINNIYKNH